MFACKNDDSEIIQLLLKYSKDNYINLILDNKEVKERFDMEIEIVREREREKRNEIEENLSPLILISEKETTKSVILTPPTLVLAIKRYIADEYDELDIKKDEFLIVTKWDCEREGWVYGHRKGNEREKGFFPKNFIKICLNDENKGIIYILI